MLEAVYTATEDRMRKALEALRAEFTSIRTGRATPALLDRLHVEAYGSSVPLKQVAGISAPDARTLLITVFDRSTVSSVKKAIETGDLGLTPNVDGSHIRLVVPPLNEERRKDLVKVVGKKAEEGKVAVRNVRHKAIDDIKALLKTNDITEDQQKRAADHVQKLTDRFIKEVESLTVNKEKEIMEV